jgi:hypothetical protein
MFNKQGVEVLTELKWFRKSPVMGCCKYDNKVCGTTGQTFLDRQKINKNGVKKLLCSLLPDF